MANPVKETRGVLRPTLELKWKGAEKLVLRDEKKVQGGAKEGLRIKRIQGGKGKEHLVKKQSSE